MSYNSLSFVIVKNILAEASGMMSTPWSQWFSTSLVPAINNTTPKVVPGPFANDAAAKTGGVPLQGLYYDVSGVPHVRIV